MVVVVGPVLGSCHEYNLLCIGLQEAWGKSTLMHSGGGGGDGGGCGGDGGGCGG